MSACCICQKVVVCTPNVRWNLPQRHVSVSYGQFSLNRDCIAHWLHVHFAPLLLQNLSIFFFYLAGHCWPHQLIPFSVVPCMSWFDSCLGQTLSFLAYMVQPLSMSSSSSKVMTPSPIQIFEMIAGSGWSWISLCSAKKSYRHVPIWHPKCQ